MRFTGCLALLLALLVPAVASAQTATPAQPAAAPEAGAYTLVLNDGKRLQLTQRPKWAFGQAFVVTTLGRRGNVAHSAVDHAATARANPASEPAREAGSHVWTREDLEALGPGGLSTLSSGYEAGPMALSPSTSSQQLAALRARQQAAARSAERAAARAQAAAANRAPSADLASALRDGPVRYRTQDRYSNRRDGSSASQRGESHRTLGAASGATRRNLANARADLQRQRNRR